MESAVERWQAIIDARARQMDAAYARLGRTSADFWDRRAKGEQRNVRVRQERIAAIMEEILTRRERQEDLARYLQAAAIAAAARR